MKYPEGLPEHQLVTLKDLVYTYREIFSDLPGLTDLLTFSIRTIDETPVRAPSYPIPQAFQEQALREIKQALDLGIIAKVIGTQYQTSYMAPIILVKKKEPNTFRLVQTTAF